MYGVSCNDNQNFRVKQGRTTSRVTNEPGGKSSVHLGWDSPKGKRGGCITIFPTNKPLTSCRPPSFYFTTGQEPNDAQKKSAMQVVGSAAASAGKANGTAETKTACDGSTSAGSRGVSSNAYANGSSQNTGNVLTDRPTSRVTQPPGGKSSISFY